MGINEIEQKLNGDLAQFLHSYIEVFERIQHYELMLSEGTVETPGAIDSAMKELVALYSTLNLATALINAKLAVHEARAYIQFKDQSNGLKTTESYLKSQVDLATEPFNRISVIFSSCRDNCDRMISVLQSSLKHAEREKILNG